MKKAENSTAGLYCIAIKDISPRECHYLSTSIYVQMAPNLLLPPPTTGFVCVRRCLHWMDLFMHYSDPNPPKEIRKFDCLSMISCGMFPDYMRCWIRLWPALREGEGTMLHPVWHLHTWIDFKIVMQTFTVDGGHQGPAPGYLVDILTRYEPDLSFRYTDRHLLAAANTNLRTNGEQGFTVRPS